MNAGFCMIGLIVAGICSAMAVAAGQTKSAQHNQSCVVMFPIAGDTKNESDIEPMSVGISQRRFWPQPQSRMWGRPSPWLACALTQGLVTRLVKMPNMHCAAPSFGNHTRV